MRTSAAVYPLLKRLLDALQLHALRESGLDESNGHFAFHREGGEWEQVALYAVGALGEAAASSLAASPFLDELAKRLNHAESHFVTRAAEVVEAIGATAGTAEIRTAIAGLLRHADGNLNATGLRLIAKLDIHSVSPELLAGLDRLLNHENEKIRRSAAAILGELHTTGIRMFRTNETFAATSVQELSQWIAAD